jgi:hypothetical protein
MQAKWYNERFYQIILFTAFVLIISYLVPALNPVFNAWMEYLSLIWWALLLGFLLGGIIDYVVPELYIQKHLALNSKMTIIKAVVLGFLMSACSHGILAISMELYKKGASTASTIAFLLASPWANLPITILLFGFFGSNAIFIIVSALLVAMITGIIFQVLEAEGIVETNKKNEKVKEISVRKDVVKRLNSFRWNLRNIKAAFLGIAKGSWELTKMVLWWILIGMLMASFIRAFVPTAYFQQFLGPSLLGLALTLFFATIIEVCSEGSAPLAFEIYHHTKALGNSFVFLMAGVITDYTEIGLIWSNIGKKAAIWMVIITVPQVLLLGYLFNIFL